MRLPRPLAAARTLLGRMLHRGCPGTPRLQLGGWNEAGIDILVAVAQGAERTTAYVFRHDPSTRALTWGLGALAPHPSHHELRTVAEAVPLGSASWRTLQGLGLVGTQEESSLAQILAYVLRDSPGAKPSARGKTEAAPRLRSVRAPGARLPRIMLTPEMRRAFGMDDADPGSAPPAPETYGFPARERPTYSLAGPAAPKPSPIEAPGRGRPTGVVPFPGAPGTDRDVVVRQVTALVHAVAGPLGARHHRESSELLGPHGWSPEGYAWYATPGEAGDRRRQAARLYPALAASIAKFPEVRACVDAGRPFEDALCEALQGLCLPGDRLAPAALRRLRTLPPDLGFGDLSVLVRWAARLPLDWLPDEAEGWQLLRQVLAGAHHLISRQAFDLADLARETGRDWRALIGLGEPSASDADDLARFLEALAGGWDMAHHLAATLVSPVARSLGLPERSSDEARLACRILFGGKAARTVARVERRWHRGRAALDAALPADVAVNAWPVPFPPFTAADGITIACLADDAALRAEGGEGPDADGMAGLAHCVGGYGRRCYTAEAVVASVRRRGEDGRMHRLSTVELHPSRDEAGAPALVLAQHRAAGNAPPPPEAEAAVGALLATLGDGSHPLDAGALAPRTAQGFIGAYDWRLPGALERAFEAWRPHLPDGTARAGLQGFVARLRAETAGWPAEPEGPRAGFDPALMRMIVLAEGLPGGIALRRAGA